MSTNIRLVVNEKDIYVHYSTSCGKRKRKTYKYNIENKEQVLADAKDFVLYLKKNDIELTDEIVEMYRFYIWYSGCKYHKYRKKDCVHCKSHIQSFISRLDTKIILKLKDINMKKGCADHPDKLLTTCKLCLKIYQKQYAQSIM